jgi:hypothetical protein
MLKLLKSVDQIVGALVAALEASAQAEDALEAANQASAAPHQQHQVSIADAPSQGVLSGLLQSSALTAQGSEQLHHNAQRIASRGRRVPHRT